MRGLLIKDFYNIWKQGLWYAAMIAMFCGISVIAENPAFSATIGILASASVPLTAIAYEEKDGWQKFAAAGGLSAGTVVAEKYLLGILFALPGAVGYCIAFAVVGTETAAAEFAAPLCMQLFAPAAVLPLIFRFGIEKGRTYMIALVVVFMLVFIGLMPLVGKVEIAQSALIACLFCATAVILAVSYRISVALYRKKEF